MPTSNQSRPESGHASNPFAFIVDGDERVCRALGIVLAKLGIETASFASAKVAIAAFEQRRPQIVFLDVALAQSDAVDMVNGLGQTGYDGTIQLITDASPTIVATIMRIGARYGLRLRPVLQKPFRGGAIREIVADLLVPAAAAG
jgi:FixJ family two-component response regulator